MRESAAIAKSSSSSSPLAAERMVSTNSTAVGRIARLASRRPPIVYGETTRLAPAKRSLGSASGRLARATMNSSGLSTRAESVT